MLQGGNALGAGERAAATGGPAEHEPNGGPLRSPPTPSPPATLFLPALKVYSSSHAKRPRDGAGWGSPLPRLDEHVQQEQEHPSRLGGPAAVHTNKKLDQTWRTREVKGRRPRALARRASSLHRSDRCLGATKTDVLSSNHVETYCHRHEDRTLFNGGNVEMRSQ